MIPIYKPYFTKDNLKYAHDAIDSTWVSSQGKYLDLVKEKLKEILGVRYLILTNNGTTATHLLALSLKFKYPHIKKIIVPNNVYVAVWNTFLYDKNYKLIPIDADYETWNFDISKISENLDSETAILVAHNMGNVVNILELKKKFPETVIMEDNCEGFLGEYGCFKTGTKSFVSSISFFGNKNLTSGEGGAFLTNDEEVFEYINIIKNQGQSDQKFIHSHLGYNYRMTNIQAALLFGQLEVLNDIIQMKEEIFELYKKSFCDIDEINFQIQEQDTKHSNWMFGIKFPSFNFEKKKEIEHYLFESGIDIRPMFYPISRHTHLGDIVCDVTIAQKLNEQCIILPSYPELNKSQIYFISDKIKKFLRKKY